MSVVRFKKCKWCKQPFEGLTGALFCSPACRELQKIEDDAAFMEKNDFTVDAIAAGGVPTCRFCNTHLQQNEQKALICPRGH